MGNASRTSIVARDSRLLVIYVFHAEKRGRSAHSQQPPGYSPCPCASLQGRKTLHLCSNRRVSSGFVALARLDVAIWQVFNATVCISCCRPCPGLGHSAASDRGRSPIASDSGLSFLHCNKTIVCTHVLSSILRTHVVPALLQAVHSFPIHDACSPIDTINRGLRLVNIFALSLELSYGSLCRSFCHPE